MLNNIFSFISEKKKVIHVLFSSILGLDNNNITKPSKNSPLNVGVLRLLENKNSNVEVYYKTDTN